MLCLSGFELYSRWVPLANGIELSLLSITSRRSRLRIKKILVVRKLSLYLLHLY